MLGWRNVQLTGSPTQVPCTLFRHGSLKDMPRTAPATIPAAPPATSPATPRGRNGVRRGGRGVFEIHLIPHHPAPRFSSPPSSPSTIAIHHNTTMADSKILRISDWRILKPCFKQLLLLLHLQRGWAWLGPARARGWGWGTCWGTGGVPSPTASPPFARRASRR